MTAGAAPSSVEGAWGVGQVGIPENAEPQSFGKRRLSIQLYKRLNTPLNMGGSLLSFLELVAWKLGWDDVLIGNELNRTGGKSPYCGSLGFL